MADLPTGMEVSKVPIMSLIMVFVIYLVIHIMIAVMLKKKKEELEALNKESVEYKETINSVKWLGIIYKWFPAVAVIMILIGFYL